MVSKSEESKNSEDFVNFEDSKDCKDSRESNLRICRDSWDPRCSKISGDSEYFQNWRFPIFWRPKISEDSYKDSKSFKYSKGSRNSKDSG